MENPDCCRLVKVNPKGKHVICEKNLGQPDLSSKRPKWYNIKIIKFYYEAVSITVVKLDFTYDVMDQKSFKTFFVCYPDLLEYIGLSNMKQGFDGDPALNKCERPLN